MEFVHGLLRAILQTGVCDGETSATSAHIRGAGTTTLTTPTTRPINERRRRPVGGPDQSGPYGRERAQSYLTASSSAMTETVRHSRTPTPQ